ncbi:unnamed protein product [Oreochromis niloticus]|nr:unnamed protein product [Mustela putorius furo]
MRNLTFCSRMLHPCFDVFSVLYTCIVLGLIPSCQGQSEVISPNQPVVATVGDNIILPCYLFPTIDASDMTVEWSRPDLDLRLVHVWPERPELQNPSYKGRTSLFINGLKHGEISLKISEVKLSDEGKYRCFVPDLRKDSTVQFIVSVVSSPVISLSGIDKNRGGVVLQCESAGWYPEPELLWLDAEGKLLSAGPTETLRGPDDLYTVSSRVTVEKRHSNNITCRVQQRNTNQSRETHIHVPDDFFMVIPSGPPSHPISDPNVTVPSAVTVSVVLLIAAVFFVWKWRGGKFKKKKSEEDGAEQAEKKKMISCKNDNSGLQEVEGQSKPLMPGREKDDDVDNREEQRHEDERETKPDQFVLDTEQIKDINCPQERRINPSNVIDKESLITIEQETHEEQEVTGREEDDVKNREEKIFKAERETQQGDHETEKEQGRDTETPQERRINPSTVNDKESLIKMEHKTLDMTGKEEKDDVDTSENKKKRQKKMVMKKTKKKHSKEVDTNSSGTKTSAVTETEPRFDMKQEIHEEQSRRGRHETHNVDIRGEKRNKDIIKTQRTAEDRINLFIMTEKVSQSTTEQETEAEEEMTGMKAEDAEERKREEERGQTESMSSSVSSKVPLNTDLKIQNETRGQNHEKQPEETSQQSWEEIREQPEELRGAERKEGAQGEELMEVDTQSRIKLHEVCKLSVKEEEIQASKHQNFKNENQYVNKQNDQFMEVDDAAHCRSAATSQLYKTIQWTIDQQVLHFQTEQQEYRKESNEDLMEGEEYSGVQFSPFTEEHKEEPMQLGKVKCFDFTFHLSTDQEPWGEKETQQEQLVEKRHKVSDVDMKESDTKEKKAEENSDVFMAQKETQREKLEAEQQREENQRDKMGMTERKREEERGQTESTSSSVSSKVPLNTDLKIQNETRGQNHEKQPEETSQQSWEEIREQPEELRGAERKEGAQGKELEVNEGLKSEETNRMDKEKEKKLRLPDKGELQAEQQVNVNQNEQLEESVSLTEKKVDCVEGKQEEELLLEEASDVDQKNNQSRKHIQEIKLQEVCTLPVKRQKIQEYRRTTKYQNIKKAKTCVKKQKGDHMEVDDSAHCQNEATSQLYETIQRTQDQQKLPVQTEPQECLKENNKDLEDQMEVD